MDRGHSTKRESHPKETANVLSLLTFFYTLKLFIKGYRKGLQSDDLYDVLKSCRAKPLGDLLEKQWEIEEKHHEKPSICRALWECFGKTFIILGVIRLIVKMMTIIWSPLALSKVIAYFSPEQKDLTKRDAVYYACVVIVINLFNVFFNQNYILALNELNVRLKTAICSLLYRKSLKFSTESLSNVTVGKITTLINRDVDLFEMLIFNGNDIWVALIQTGVVCYLIYYKIGAASFAGIAFFFVVLIIQAFIGTKAYKLRLRTSKKTDERLEVMQEVLSAIKNIKAYTWEMYFEKKIGTARKKELKELHRLFYTKVCIQIIGTLCSNIAFFIFIMTYVWMGNTATAEIIYLILSYTNDLKNSLSNLIPFGFSYVAEIYAVAKRIESVLEVKELQRKETNVKTLSVKITLAGVSSEINGVRIFDNVSLTIDKRLSVVVGNVGSGKTTFLRTILQDYKVSGDLKISGTISYASQVPWLFPSSIKNNIIFGEKFCEKRYKKVLEICCLDYDLNLLDEGDDTVIDDRGINLSKGQQARINLARAVYRDSDIYLLDDCLAALDAHVSDNIFKECIQKFLKNKLCVFITNNYSYVEQADEIIMIHKGSIQFVQKTTARIENDNTIIDNDQNERDIKEIINRKQIYKEVKKFGKVSIKDYYRYVKFGGGLLVFAVIMGLFIADQTASSLSTKMISNWVNLEQNLSTLLETNKTNTIEYEETYKARTYNLNFYIIVAIISVMLSLIRSLAFFNFTRRASVNMHKAMVRCILNSTMKFFDCNFIGNILNRFSKDCVTIDEYFPFVLMGCLMMVFTISGGIILLTTVHVIFVMECSVVLIIAILLRRFYQPIGRDLQRLTSLTRCPIIGHLNSTLEGLTTIRASNAQQIISDEFDRHQNLYTSATYLLNNTLFALAFSLDLVCAIFITLVIIQFLITDLNTSVGDVGLVITQSFIISDIVTNGIKSIADCESLMTLVERMIEYTEIKEEDKSGEILTNWPNRGLIIFDNVSLKYNDTTKDILHGINLIIEPKKKLGIIGRTGAGKSSIISSLLRLYQIHGKITIDELDIKKVPLVYLRSNIAIIPQDLFLFSGTVRENLDPNMQYSDEQIWKILDELKLKTLITDLNSYLDKGLTLSTGQKQLICLARAILCKNKIVVMDEVTANVDRETDLLIQDVIQNYFAESTVIIIAHRLHSILKCQKVVVLSKGQIVEYDEPKNLLKNKNSFLHNICR